MGPDPTRAYLWPDPKIFFWPEGEKIENWTFLGEIFHEWLTRPNPTRATKNWPDMTRIKNFWPGPITVLKACDRFVKRLDISAIKSKIWNVKLITVLGRELYLETQKYSSGCVYNYQFIVRKLKKLRDTFGQKGKHHFFILHMFKS